MAYNSKNFGKIRYIEPNDFRGPFNITHPYEDYSISVDLIVTNSERIKCGNIENNTIKVYSNNLTNEKISFFNYNKDYLTDTSNSIVYEDILNNKETKENLGITDIHISYNSYFYPQVTIKFTDIRGGALMMPNEEIYRRGQNNITDKVSNFFAVLFNFPYPEFTLRVKGFYGKKVDFSLVVEEFKSSFNNQTGNFDATVKFIGKMYGVYTDIPMSYLLIAPYCMYDGHNNQTIWDELDFKFDEDEGGAKMPTFLELQEIIMTSESNIGSVLSDDLINQFNDLNNKSILIEEISNNYSDLLSFIKNNEGLISNDLILIPKEIIENSNKLNELNTKIQKLCELITKNNNETNIEIPYPYPFTKNKQKIEINDNYYVEISLNSELEKGIENIVNNIKTYVNVSSSNTKLKEDVSNNEGSLIKIREHFFNKGINNKSFFCIEQNSFYSCITNIRESTNKEINDNNKKIETDYNTKVETLIGFKPSIKNIFKILMAHLQCFIEIYNRFSQKTINNENRFIEKLNINLKNTDINLKNIKNVLLPCFPAFIDNENNFVYPNKILNTEIDETLLIDALLDGTFNFLRKKDEVDKLKEELNDTSLDFIPTCLTDLINFTNPYDNILNFKNDGKSNDVEVLFTFFGMRCISKYILEQNNNLSSDEFGKLEAYNFWRTNQSVGHRLKDLISNDEFNSNNFLLYLSGKKNTYLTSNPYYSDNNVKNLINYENNNISIPNKFNFPAIIGRLNYSNDFISIFKNDYKVNDCSVSFKYNANNVITKNNRPIGFIDFVDITKLDKINDKLNILDTSEYCKEENKKKILEYYLTNVLNDKNVIYNSNVYYSSNNSNHNEKLGYDISLFESDKYISNNYINYREAFLQNFKQNSDDNEKILKLFSIQTKGENNKPIFCNNYIDTNEETENNLIDESTPEEFLSSVEHNIFSIVDTIKEGKTVLTIPYITKLFIGMLITKLKEGKDSLNSIIIKNQIELYNQNTYNSQGQMSKDGGLKYRKYIYYLLNIFMRANDGTYNEECFDESITNAATDALFYENNGTSIKKYFQKDIYDLSKEYKEWSETIFENLKNEYKFDYNNIEYVLNEWKGGKFNLNIDRETNNTKESIQAVINSNIGGENFCKKYSGIKYDGKNIYLIFNQEYESYKELEKLFNDVCKFVIPYQMKPYELTNGNISINKSIFETSFNFFKKELLKLYKYIDSETGEEIDNSYLDYTSYNVSVDNKLSMYKTLKNLEDKHFYNFKNGDYIEKFKLKSDKTETEFDRFHFIDSFYNDIGNEIMFNLEELTSILGNITENSNNKIEGVISNEMSVYSFMSLLCQKNNMMLMAMPIFNGNFTGKNGSNNFETMFTPITYNATINNNIMSGPSYICFYPHQPSQHLDNPNSQYKNDGFNIIQDINDTGNFEGPIDIPDLAKSDSRYIIPAFSVEYGSQKQSIFKNINVNMDNPQTTEVAVAIQFGLANKNNETPQKVSFQGQDLYKIYSNYSYTCDVEMMGCAQIQPLMYFQLNNIPMFRGAYIIISVEHRIVPGDMTTTFRGVRINKNKIPRVTSCISIERLKGVINKENNIITNNVIKTPIIIRELPENESRSSFMENIDDKINFDIVTTTYKDYIKFSGNKELQKNNFNLLNSELRNLIYHLLGDLEKLSQKLPYKIGIEISSTTRDYVPNNGSKTSDHLINLQNPNEKRKGKKGYDANGNYTTYDKLGCAIDLHGTKDGKKDKGEASIIVFNLIAKNYQKYIRQLLWEVIDSNSTLSDNISNCIHLGSYGKDFDNDKKELLMVLKETNFKSHKGNINTFSVSFLKIVKDLMNMDNKGKAWTFNSQLSPEKLNNLNI